MMERLRLAILRHRLALVVAVHLLLFVVSYYLAFVIRLESFGLRRLEGPGRFQDFQGTFLRTLPFLVAIRVICFWWFDLYRGCGATSASRIWPRS
jgi:hypothetical protein